MKKSIMQQCIAILLFPAIAIAKTPGPGDPIQPKILNAINLFYQAFPLEKIHLQFNKNGYAPGEDIWFKSYLLPFHDTTYTSISKIEYVELIDMNNNLIKRIVLPVENGSAIGHFRLGTTFNEGVYHVRAYTAWMLNFDSLFLFNRDIPVFSKSRSMHSLLPAGKNYVVQFYPEGGYLVTGLTSLVAYKATDENGNPVAIEGKLMDDKGNVRALLHTGADGTGSFNMHAEDGFTYSAVTNLPNGLTKTFSLPAIKKSGVVLHVVDKPDSAGNSSLYFHIARGKFEKELYNSITICAHTDKYNQLLNINFDPKYAGDYNDTILVAADPLALKNDAQGIAHITVFNGDGEPLADRMVFLHTGKKSTPALQPVNISATGKNEFTLLVPGDDQGQYSVSVVNADGSAETADENNILTDFYLPGFQNQSSLSPGYFEDTSDEMFKNLNLLMLTNKWIFFDWHKMLANNFPHVNYLPEQSLFIKGTVTVDKYGKKQPYAEKSIPLMMKNDRDSIRTFLNIPVDADGNFIENNLYFHDTASFYYQSSEQKSKKVVTVTFVKTETDSVLSRPFYYRPYNRSKYIAVKPGTAPNNFEAGVNDNDSTALKNVTVVATAKSHLDSLDDAYTSGLFAGRKNFMRTFDLSDDPVTEDDHTTNVLQYLQGRVPGLTITGDVQNMPVMYWRLNNGLLTNNIASDPIAATILNMPIFFIDERQVNTNELFGGGAREELSATMLQLTGIKVSDVAYIKVYEPGTFYGAEGGAGHGAIAIYLKKGYKNNQNMNSLAKQGFSYIPNFTENTFNKIDNQTIYWNPDVRTNPQTHAATISFTNNTGAKKMMIVVEGIDKKGQPLRIEKIFSQQ